MPKKTVGAPALPLLATDHTASCREVTLCMRDDAGDSWPGYQTVDAVLAPVADGAE